MQFFELKISRYPHFLILLTRIITIFTTFYHLSSSFPNSYHLLPTLLPPLPTFTSFYHLPPTFITLDQWFPTFILLQIFILFLPTFATFFTNFYYLPTIFTNFGTTFINFLLHRTKCYYLSPTFTNLSSMFSKILSAPLTFALLMFLPNGPIFTDSPSFFEITSILKGECTWKLWHRFDVETST